MQVGRRAAIVSTVAAAAVALTVPLAVHAAAADPPHTIALASGKSAFPDSPRLLGMLSNSVVFATGAGLFTAPKSPGAAHQIAPTNHYYDSSGNYVWTENGSARTWHNVTHASDTGSVPKAWQAAYPGGGLFITATHPRVLAEQTYAQAGTTSQTTLATLPSYVGRDDQILVGPAGAAVISSDPDTGDSIVNYVPFTSPSLNSVQVPSGSQLYCGSISTSAIGCQNDNQVVRLSLTGGAPVTTSGGSQIDFVAVTESTTAWTTFSGKVKSVPAAGGPVSTLAGFTTTGDQDLTADDSMFYLARSGALGVDGIYRVANAASSPTKLLAASGAPLFASGVGLSAGRAGWTDNSKKSWPVWSRSLTTNGGTITAGAPDVVGSSGASGTGAPSMSGIRTTWATLSSPTGTGYGINISDGKSHTVLTDKSTFPATLSGMRALYQRQGGGSTDGHFIVYNLVGKTKTDLTSKYKAEAADVWGNYAVYAIADGSVWRKDLSSSAAPVKIRPALASGNKLDFATVVTSGDWVGWTIDYHHKNTYSSAVGFRNARTMAASVALPNDELISANNAGLVLRTPHDAYQLRPWTSSKTLALPTPLVSVPTVYGSLVGWTGQNGEPKVAPLSKHFANQPRALESPPNETVKHGHAWTFDLVTSAPLTSCSVKIATTAGKAVRTLGCSKSAMKVGEVMASWGSTKAGKYRWTVSAKNSDGALLNADGTKAPTTGKITIS